MVHELFGIENNRVNLKNVPDVPKEDQVRKSNWPWFSISKFFPQSLPLKFLELLQLKTFATKVLVEVLRFLTDHFFPQEMVLSSEQDEFFKANMYENYGDVTQNVAKLRDDFGRTDSNKKGNSIGLPSFSYVIPLYPLSIPSSKVSSFRLSLYSKLIKTRKKSHLSPPFS